MTEPITEPAEAPAANAAPDAGVPNVTPEPEPVGESSSDANEPDTADQGDIGKARKEAAKYRTQLRETEAERDQLRDQLAAQRRAIIDHQATARGVDPQLLDAAGINIDELLDDESQHVDLTKVADFVDETATRFKVARGFTTNRAQGASGATPPSKPSLADAFRN